MGSDAGKPRQYYSSRAGKQRISLQAAQWRLNNLYLLFRGRDYFKEKLGVQEHIAPDSLAREAAVRLGFVAFPIAKWAVEDITADHVFDVIEFLYDRSSQPGELIDMRSSTGWESQDYDSYDEDAGKNEFRAAANLILFDMDDGFELGPDGRVRSNGADGLQHILSAEIVPFDPINVDNKVILAIERWRQRHATLEDKKEAVRLLADVFEWLRDTKKLGAVLDKKDESDLFNLANNFAIRHHEQSQKSNYDKMIWLNWMFHFYLATYHASIRLLLKAGKRSEQAAKTYPRG